MKIKFTSCIQTLMLLALVFFSVSDLKSQVVTTTFFYTGTPQTYTVPAGVYLISIECRGAEGGGGTFNLGSDGYGGKGGVAKGTLVVVPGQILNIFVGGKGTTGTASGSYLAGGYNGGGGSGDYYLGARGSGGGASDVRIGGGGLSDRIIVGGGGGGACCTFRSVLQGVGGYGGYPNGGDGLNADLDAMGGTQTTGGLTGCPACCSLDGSFGLGGDVPGACSSIAGGGGGWYGGGAGNNGGGGSSYLGGVQNTSYVNGSNAGNGLVIISFDCAPAPTISDGGICLVSSPGVTYQWYLNGVAINGATSQTYVSLNYGNYTVVVKDVFGCIKTSAPYSSNIDFDNNCPQIHKNFGTHCDDGDPQTINDRVRNDCKCRGDYFSKSITVKCPLDTVVVTTSKYGTIINWDEGNMFKVNLDSGECVGKNIVDIKHLSGYYSGYPFEPGAVVQETYIATDECGNKSSCNFMIRTTTLPQHFSALPVTSTNTLRGMGLSPNPASNSLNVSLTSEIEAAVEIKILNAMGQVMMTQTHRAETGFNNFILDISTLQRGFYFVSSSLSNQTPLKFVKE